MYVPRNFKPIDSFYVDKNDYDFQNYLRLLWRKSNEIKSKTNIQFLCGQNLYQKLKNKKLPPFVNIVKRTDLSKNYGEIMEIKL